MFKAIAFVLLLILVKINSIIGLRSISLVFLEVEVAQLEQVLVTLRGVFLESRKSFVCEKLALQTIAGWNQTWKVVGRFTARKSLLPFFWLRQSLHLLDRYLRVMFTNVKPLVWLGEWRRPLIRNLLCNLFLEGERYIHKLFTADIFFLGLEIQESEIGHSFEFVVILHGTILIKRSFSYHFSWAHSSRMLESCTWCW